MQNLPVTKKSAFLLKSFGSTADDVKCCSACRQRLQRLASISEFRCKTNNANCKGWLHVTYENASEHTKRRVNSKAKSIINNKINGLKAEVAEIIPGSSSICKEVLEDHFKIQNQASDIIAST